MLVSTVERREIKFPAVELPNGGTVCYHCSLRSENQVFHGSLRSYRSYAAMDRILKGIMKYRKCHREGMVKQFQQVRDHPEVRSYSAKKRIPRDDSVHRDHLPRCRVHVRFVDIRP